MDTNVVDTSETSEVTSSSISVETMKSVERTAVAEQSGASLLDNPWRCLMGATMMSLSSLVDAGVVDDDNGKECRSFLEIIVYRDATQFGLFFKEKEIYIIILFFFNSIHFYSFKIGCI